MQVKALARGVYGRFYEAGQKFDIIDDSHLGSWMEPVKEEDRKRLADRMEALRTIRKPVTPPDAPQTTAKSSGMNEIPMPKVKPKPK
jgi:hypothetical protein